MEMRIRNIDPETRKVIKETARENKMTTAQYLDLVFRDVQPPPGKYSKRWHVKNINKDTQEKIREQAGKKKKTIGQYLEELVYRDIAKDEEEAKKGPSQFKKDIMQRLDDIYGLIDNIS